MKYYLIENGEKTGPFTIEELEKKDIYENTLVWTKGLKDWTEAKYIPMLKNIIDETPPKPPKNENKYNSSPPPPFNQNINSKYFGYKLASKWDRFLAALVGGLIIGIPIIILTGGGRHRNSFISTSDIVIDVIVAIIIGALLYPIWSGNLGHKIFGLKVISKENGKDVTNAKDGIIREVTKSLLSYFIIPIIWLLWDDDRQNLYDKISKTIVVKKKEI